MYLLNNYDTEACDINAAIKYLLGKGTNTNSNIADAMFYWSEALKHNIKFNFLFAQHLLETGNGTSFWYKYHNNYAGIGVTGEQSSYAKEGYYYDTAVGLWRKGINFDSKADGLRGHIAHIDSFVFSEPRFDCDKVDTRYSIVRAILKERGLKYVDNLETLAPIYADDKNYYNKIMAIITAMMKYK